MISLQKVDHIGLYVRDLRQAEEFYTEILGMKVEMRLADQILLRFGETHCALFLKSDMPKPELDLIEQPLGKAHHAFGVSSEHFEQALKEFPRKQIPCHRPIDWGDHDCLYFLDPDGNLLELIRYRK